MARGRGGRLDPSLPPQLTGVRASALHWRGRTLSVAVGPWTTLVTLESGRPVRVSTPAGTRLLRSTLVLPTRRPDRKPTTDLARCHTATAAPATAEPAEAAVDGTVITQWIGDDPSARLTVDLGRAKTVGTVTVARNPVTTYPAPPGGDKGVTKPTVSAAPRSGSPPTATPGAPSAPSPGPVSAAAWPATGARSVSSGWWRPVPRRTCP